MSKHFHSFLLLLVLTLASCKVNHLAQIQPQGYRMQPQSTTVPPADAATEAFIAPYKAKLDAEMNEVLGTAARTLEKAKPESPLGNWMADLFYEQISIYNKGEIDFASMNYGGIRIPTLQAGEVTRGKIFELMPFDNMLVVVHADAATVRAFVDKIAKDGGIPVSKQLRFNIKSGKAENITINGQPLQEDKIYKIGVSDYVANGGDDCTFFVGKKRDELGVLMRDAIIDYVKKQTAQGKQLNAQVDGRIK
ncbi:MAG: 5'-nucleotidase C-terminal domain-containing protein [Saprospiraceae bacterium]